MTGAKSVVIIALMAITLLVLTACGSRNQEAPAASAADDVAAAAQELQEVADLEVLQVAEAETHDVNEETAADHEDSEATCHRDDEASQGSEASHGSETDAVACTHDDEAVDEHSDEVTESHHDEDSDTAIHVENGVADGLQLFRAFGCAACHGMDGEGILGPAMAGHTAEQIHNQVRIPVSSGQFKDANDNLIVMPAFVEEVISDDQLDLIAAWVASLGPATGEHAHMHQADGDSMEEHMAGMHGTGSSDPIAMMGPHMRLALYALENGLPEDAGLYLESMLPILEDEHAAEQVGEIVALLGKDADLHDLEHEIAHLMEDVAVDTLSENNTRFHVQLALDSIALDESDMARLHLSELADGVSAEDKELIAQALGLLAEGEIHEAEEILQQIMGLAVHTD